MSRLLVVSHTPHYRQRGAIVGWGPTVRELDHLATLFDHVVHLAPLHDGPPPRATRAYENEAIELRPVPPAGGATVGQKIRSVPRWIAYAGAIRRELAAADAVHIRFPAMISLVALAVLPFGAPRTRWMKYAGNWRPSRPGEPLSYRLQRFLLRLRWHRSMVTVNGAWPDSPAHVRPFINPCLTVTEVAEGRKAAEAKPSFPPVRLLFVGRLDAAKGVWKAIEVVRRLAARSMTVHLDVVGDGPDLQNLRSYLDAERLDGLTTVHGSLDRTALDKLYARAHFLLLPSRASEGWPKVLAEAMAFGAVPIATAISSIPQQLREKQAGIALDPGDEHQFENTVCRLASSPGEWQNLSLAGLKAASEFTYEAYLAAVESLLELHRQDTLDRDSV